MTQLLQPHHDAPHAEAPPLSVWGLAVPELHDAYWRGRGVQCVRPGLGCAIDRAADLFLLMDARQLVLFDLSRLVDRLVWHGAAVTFVQIIDVVGPHYRERLVTDAAGFVQRIARHYGPVKRARCRVLITDRPRLAATWAAAGDGRAARRAVRLNVNRAGIDRMRALGRHVDPLHREECRDFMSDLVERWHNPGSVIEGIEEVAPGVWKREGEAQATRAPRIGPVWIGCGEPEAEEPMVGPAVWFDTGSDAKGRSAVIRPLRAIEPRTSSAPVPARQGLPVYQALKRAFDVATSAVLLVALAPLFAVIALAVRLDDGGPVLFRHRRQSIGGRRFDCLKFRTMRPDAEGMVPSLAGRNLCDGPQVFIQDDPRVTRIGRMLRRLHLDELPQFWNVLRGEMSLVGPRPSPDRENQMCPAWRELRLSVRPGITGLWQLERTRKPGRDFQEWIQYDIEYVRRASLWLDLRICLRTALQLVSGRSGS